MPPAKLLENVFSLSDVKTNPGRVLKRVAESHRPALLTNRGRGVAVVQALSDYEEAEEERVFMRAVVQGLADVAAGRTVELAQAKKRLGLV